MKTTLHADWTVGDLCQMLRKTHNAAKGNR